VYEFFNGTGTCVDCRLVEFREYCIFLRTKIFSFSFSLWFAHLFAHLSRPGIDLLRSSSQAATCLLSIAVGYQMFSVMQDFDFAQIQSNLPKSNHFCPNYASILPKFSPNSIKFAQI